MSFLKRAETIDGKFQNPVPTAVGDLSTVIKLLPRMLFGKEERVPRVAQGPFRTDARVYATPPASGLRVTWFGHSGLLVELDGFRVLIDPVWEQRASPMQWGGPKRFWSPTLALSDLPALDAVVISHDHYDHLGEHTVRALATLPSAAGARWVTSLGVGPQLQKMGVAAARISELNWTESVELGSLKLTAWPSRHFSGRSMFNRFTSLWSSFVIEGPQHRVFYGADSGWWDGFAEIGAQYDRFDLTMLEIGAFDPAWDSIHLGPDNAVRAYEALGGAAKAGLLMPIHWGLFSLALHGWREPMEQIMRHDVPLWSPEPGKPTEVLGPEVAGWWRSSRS